MPTRQINRMKRTTSNRQILTDFLIPMVIQFFTFGILCAIFAFCVKQGPLLQEVRVIGNETSSPTLGRLIYGFVTFLAFAVCSYFASKYADDRNSTRSFWFGFAGGILLWQSLGEIMWHFYVGGVSFAQLENITSFPFVIIILMVFIYGKQHHSFDWGIWCVMVSFMCNWLTHYASLGLYPFVSGFVDAHTWTIGASSVTGALMILSGIRNLLFRANTKRSRAQTALITFIGIATIFFGRVHS